MALGTSQAEQGVQQQRQQARAASAKGDNRTALQLFRQAAEGAPEDWTCHAELARELRLMGYLQDAIVSLRQAIAVAPGQIELRCELIDVLGKLGREHVIATECEELLKRVHNHAEVLLPAALALEKSNQVDASLAALRRLIELQPCLFDAQQHLRRLQTDRIPPWHFVMMNDEPRNQAYEAALQRAVTPGSHVFEIGTGSGILSMLAARAGAARVTTCEANPQIAAVAQEIIKNNGYENIITVIPRPSWEIDVERDLGGKPDLFLAEILSDTLLDEGILRTTDQARRDLLKPGAPLIPHGVSAMARLVGGQALASTTMVTQASGFDLSAFNRYIPASLFINCDSRELLTLSDDIEVFRFDLDRELPKPEQRDISCQAREDGLCIGVLQWVRLYMDAETVFENRPADRFAPSAWRQRLFPFAEPIAVKKGEQVDFRASHNIASLAFDRRVV
ncbi:MAG: 50S ribosomal protein L11 methyltransferase [Alphaproteobacteria bacterium]